MPPKEICIICDQETGNAGILDGSLFDVEGGGPYCDECWEKLADDLKDDNEISDQHNKDMYWSQCVNR